MPRRPSDFELALLGALSTAQGYQVGAHQKDELAIKMAERKDAQRKNQADEFSRFGAPYDVVARGEELRRFTPVGPMADPSDMGAVGRFDAFTQRMSQKGTSAIFDPDTGQLTTVPSGTKISPRSAAGKESMSTSSILTRMRGLEEKRLSKSMSPDEEQEYQGWTSELRRRGGLGSGVGSPSVPVAAPQESFMNKLMGSFKKKPPTGLPGLD